MVLLRCERKIILRNRCLDTAQRSAVIGFLDSEPCMLDVEYRRRHACLALQFQNIKISTASSAPEEKRERGRSGQGAAKTIERLTSCGDVVWPPLRDRDWEWDCD